MEIDITDQQKKLPLKISSIQTNVETILRHLKIRKADLSLAFVSSQKIRALNIKYLNRAHTTDVLAFDLSSGEDGPGVLTGEVIISTDAVVQNARRFGTTPASELALYIIHGILHLTGYDDHAAADRERMRAKEQEVLRALGERPAAALRKSSKSS
ncbi:MAG: rRNA maturation RNase YbeY [Candidatus Omnitrophica bacterium]|nr:rRNA maturation RNase YbeY [Candidatus Omnitrophota bacterium]MCB9720768.1 rRNA maturation RNase YbeY [Candidatus Omnitrophota bacterium]